MRIIAITRNRLRVLLLTLLSFLLISPFVIRKQQASSVVTITEFSDFQCPYCKWAASVVEQVRQSYGDKVKVVFKQMPLPMHKQAFKAAQASVCAREQGRFWEYHDRLFAASDLSGDVLNRIGAEVGLNRDEFNQCLASQTSRAEVEKDLAEAERLGVSGTPTFFVNGKVVRGAATLATLTRAIDGTLTKPAGEGSLESSTRATVAALNTAQPIIAPAGDTQQAPKSSTATLSIDDVTLAEDSCQGKSFVFTVTLSKLANQTVTVHYATSDGAPNLTPAVANKDYVPVAGTLSFTHDGAIEGPKGTYLLKITVPLGNYVVSTATNDGRAFTVTLSGATNATLSKSQGVGTLLNGALRCAAGTNCFVNYCGAAKSCTHVDVSSCSLPANEANCKLSSACNTGDSDGDGLSDAWERAGGIDFNCDGELTPDETVLTNVDPVFPDGTSNPHSSADPNVKDVFVKYDWMELADQLTNGQPTACTINPLPFPGNLFYPYHSDQCAFDQACVTGQCRGHSDEPDPAALKMVIDSFAAHNIRLHLLKGRALPHANVISYGPPVEASIADTANLTFSGNHATDFYALKTASFNAQYNGQNFTEAQMFPIFHYAIFGHRHSCDSISDCAKAESINPDTGRTPFFNETGLAEQPGNDLIVSMGGLYRDRLVSPSLLAQGGTFMHELGHNLGLDHGGPLYIGGQPTDYNQVHLNFKPNYLSVMNYNHQTVGIGTADPNCAPNDYVCKTTPVKVRLDYSSFNPGFTPNTLDENNGTEAAGLNLGNNDIAFTWCPSPRAIPGMGPVDFNCNGIFESWCAFGCDITPGFELNHDPAGGGMTPNGSPGSGDVLQPFEDWPNLFFFFQCQSTSND